MPDVQPLPLETTLSTCTDAPAAADDFWQERFYSCVLGETHLASALRYFELIPVRARIVCKAAAYLVIGGDALPPRALG